MGFINTLIDRIKAITKIAADAAYHIRHRLTANTTNSAIYTEQVRILYHHAPSILFGNLLVAALCALVMSSFIALNLVLVWAALIYLLTFSRIKLVRAYHQQIKNTSPSVRSQLSWGHWFIASSFVSGCIWGSMSFIAFDTHYPISVLFTGLILAGMTGGCVASLSVVPWGYPSFAIPAALPFALRCLWVNDDIYHVFGLCALLLLGINIYYSAVVRRATTDAITLRFENIELIEQLRDAKNLAEKASRAKTRFLAAASHDLRQPTHALGLFLGVLERLWARRVSEDEVRPIFSRIQITLDSMNKLLGSLLDISRLDADAVTVQRSAFPLQKIFDRLAPQMAASLDSNQSLRIHPTRLQTYTDEHLLTQILANLLSNAIRYNPGGIILLGCRRRGKEIEIQVLDNGPGITAEDQHTIFEEFVQLGNPERNPERGLGLGLAIVKRLSRLLQHKIHLSSITGKGSCFSVLVPLTTCTQEYATSNPQHTHQGNQRVLLIEDDKHAREATSLLLRTAGYEVHEAIGIKELKDFDGHILSRLDLIISDYRLGEETTGAQAVAIVCATAGRHIPALLVTGDTSPDRIREAKTSGLTLLHKPLDAEELLSCIQTVIHSATQDPQARNAL